MHSLSFVGGRRKARGQDQRREGGGIFGASNVDDHAVGERLTVGLDGGNRSRRDTRREDQTQHHQVTQIGRPRG